MFLVLPCRCLCAIYWSQVLSKKWRCWRQAMLQLHLSDQQFYCLLRCNLYQRFDSKNMSDFVVVTVLANGSAPIGARTPAGNSNYWKIPQTLSRFEKMVPCLHLFQQNLDYQNVVHMLTFVTFTAHTDDLATYGARTSSGTIMMKYGFLTHLPLNKMTAISQTTFSNAFL